MDEVLTKAQRELLVLLATGQPITIYEATAILGWRQSTVSAVRNRLLRFHYLLPWEQYGSPTYASDLGRSYLKDHPNG